MVSEAQWEWPSQERDHDCEVKSKTQVLQHNIYQIDFPILEMIRSYHLHKVIFTRCIESGQSFLEGADLSGIDVNVGFQRFLSQPFFSTFTFLSVH